MWKQGSPNSRSCCRCTVGDCSDCVCSKNNGICTACRSINSSRKASILQMILAVSQASPKTDGPNASPKSDIDVVCWGKGSPNNRRCCRCTVGDCSDCVCSKTKRICTVCQSINCRNKNPTPNSSSILQTVILATPKPDRSTASPTSVIDVVCRNINGPGPVARREAVVSATLKTLKWDILCLQENTAKYGGRTQNAVEPSDYFKRRIPIGTNHHRHGYFEVTEAISGPHNQLLYCKEKFTETNDFDSCLEKAFQLMNYQKQVIDWIESGKDSRKNKLTKNMITLDEIIRQCRLPDSDQQVKRCIEELQFALNAFKKMVMLNVGNALLGKRMTWRQRMQKNY